MKYDYIENFKKLGFGIFVHFGLYSVIGKGEWYRFVYNLSEEKYNKLTIPHFKVNKNWAKDLVAMAKKAGAKYITLTARHHDGFSLYDTCGLNDYDSLHSPSGRDLVKEFIDECHNQDIKPFLYHTLLDWHNTDYHTNFAKYIDYLIKSVEILCKNYGEIGGLWFDGFWDKPNEDWQFDRLYKTIRKYQHNALIINNTGLDALGMVSHYEIDSVTFERGKPFNVSSSDGKERAGEVCDSLTDHWGYTKEDICIKSVPYLIEEIIDCRRCGCNLLMNIGPMGNGVIRPIEKNTLLEFGKWMSKYSFILRNASPSDVKVKNAILFNDDKYYYAFMNDVPMGITENVVRRQNRPKIIVHSDLKIRDAKLLDSNLQKAKLEIKNNSIEMPPFSYGTSFHTRVIRFKLR